MLYYKVKPASDQIKAGIRFKTGILVANELYTQNEVNKAIEAKRIDLSFVRNHFTREEISPKKVYWFFGARFQSQSNAITN